FIAIILFVPLIVLTAISIIGIPLIPVIIIIFAIGAFLGYMGISLYVGNKLEELVKWEIPEYLKLIIGITILWLANRAPLIGFIVFIVIIVIGVGAVIETRFGTIKQ
ncbi:MAG TPA: hypothetical protein GX526_04965, partial [Thermoanaerobacterales bacterium]|nr:hypothetical protein [Thermoanaerobacterales bacterium]